MSVEAGRESMAREAIDPDGVKDPSDLYYSHVNVDDGEVFISGQIGMDEHNEIVSPEFEPQARRAFENLGRCLEAVDRSFDDVAKVRAFVVDPQDHYDAYLDVWKEFFDEPYPCATVIGAAELAAEGLLVEIEAEFGA